MRYILWVVLLPEDCDVANDGLHLGFNHALEIRLNSRYNFTLVLTRGGGGGSGVHGGWPPPPPPPPGVHGGCHPPAPPPMKFHVSVSSPCLFYTCNKLLYSILSVSCLFFCELYVNNSGSHRRTHWQIFHFMIICM